MLRRVDTVEVGPDDAGKYCRLIDEELAPIVEAAGATFEGWWRTPEGTAEPLLVQTVVSCQGFDAWNVIRRNLVLDPRWYACAEQLHALSRGGTRRFYRSGDG